MSYWGKMDKRKCAYVLDNGIAALKDNIKEAGREDVSALWTDLSRLEKLLYNDGRTLLSMTNKVRFEKRLNTARKLLQKLESGS